MYDLAFIGGGLSCGLTLTHLLDGSDRREGRPLRILMLDRSRDFGAGRAYGRDAHPGLLLNETVATMDTGGFSGWLAEHRRAWLDPIAASDDPAAAAWLSAHRTHLQADDPRELAALHVPRAVFGRFARGSLARRIEAAQRTGEAATELLTAEVRSVGRQAEGAPCIALADGRCLATRVAVIGLGSPSTCLAPDLRGAGGYTDDLPRDRERMRTRMASLGSATPQVVVIGGNAAAIEAVHTLAHDDVLLKRTGRVVVVAPSGRLPDGEPSGREPAPVAHQLRRLARTADPVTAEALLEAAGHDAEDARRSGYASLDFAPPIVRAFGPLFERLTDDEQRVFVETCGQRFTALRRHAPPDYAASARDLASRGRLRLIADRATAITRGAGDRFAVTLARGAAPVEADLVIDASGTRRLDPANDPLLRTILGPAGVGRVNAAGLGVEVSGTLEASPGVFVIGPLLAGHCGGAGPIWNLESAPRIDALARRLAATLRRSL